MIFLGDLHNDLIQLEKAISAHPDQDIIQVGDLGWANSVIPPLPPRFKFIRGNHDNPYYAAKHPNYLGEYGYNEDLKFFFVSGAWSIYRVRWEFWIDREELAQSELNKMLQLYQKIKPDVMVTHDCPMRNYTQLVAKASIQNRTALALDSALNRHPPKIWVHGHHHNSKIYRIPGIDTLFVGLGIAEIIDLSDLLSL